MNDSKLNNYPGFFLKKLRIGYLSKYVNPVGFYMILHKQIRICRANLPDGKLSYVHTTNWLGTHAVENLSQIVF